MKKHKFLFVLMIAILSSLALNAEDGYDLWLRYQAVSSKQEAKQIKTLFKQVVIEQSPGTFAVIQDELKRAGQGMIVAEPGFTGTLSKKASLIIGTPSSCAALRSGLIGDILGSAGEEGYFIGYTPSTKKTLIVAANTPVGALYGTFHLLRLLQSGVDISEIDILESPKITHRLLNHWDNLDRTVERGYAGFSIWDWHKLPELIDPRYIDYARANASIGINGTVLTNVNANAFVLTPFYIKKVAALADVFRPYGLKVYLTARFSSPIEIGGLKTADPLDPEVKKWWKEKTDEIYDAIPDFGGFLVKANSEGQPGPQNYDRSHADGANMLAEAVAPYDGIVMWRAFVYSHEVPDDRAKQANNEFEALDDLFLDNVFIQTKNGAIDFQPREPFHPLFGALDQTALALELQITQEYLGQGTNLVYMAPLYSECLSSNTYSPNNESTVASVIDGSDYGRKKSVMAGVSNIGNDRNWTGHLFGQSNWYAYGRLAWEHGSSPEELAEEWIRMTFDNDPLLVETIRGIMLPSREAVVNYMTPLGLHHIMGRNHHYGPGPWVEGGRPDWTSLYYHRADSVGIGFDRTASGSNALSQYAPEIEKLWSDPKTCPEKFLLWFHHLPWTYKMKSGNILWDEICYSYDTGIDEVTQMIKAWEGIEGKIDDERFKHVQTLLQVQLNEAKWWRNSCLLYFKQFSGLPFPANIEQPEGSLEEYKSQVFPYAPGIKPSW